MFRKDPVGSCFIATKNFTQFHQMRPCVETGRERPGAGAVPPRICLFFLSYSRNHLFSCIICMCRRVPQDTSGIRVTINDESPSVLASLLKIIWKNFLSIRRVRQVSPNKKRVGGSCEFKNSQQTPRTSHATPRIKKKPSTPLICWWYTLTSHSPLKKSKKRHSDANTHLHKNWTKMFEPL